jgi:tetrapyrrole methylase family protein/MazG family protein
MIRRHPHVFGNVEAQNAEEAVKSWEEAKKSENRNESESLLDSVSKALPALSKAYQYQRKAAKIGFDWPDVLDAWEKVSEELQEFKKEIDNGDGGTEKAKEEFGDILFALINVGRFYEIEPEEALVMTNEKFSRRFRFIEQKARDAGKNLKSMSLAEMDQYWEEAKMKERDRT